MSARHVTAVVLLSRSTTALTHRATLAALGGQTRPADAVVVVAPSDLPEDVLGAVEEDVSSSRADELLTVSAALGRAGTVREALALISRRTDERTGADEDDQEHDGSAGPADEDSVPSDPAGRGDSARRRGRRARAVDPGAIERERTQRAEDLALVPERLRDERHRSGRRVGLAEGAADRSWLWFVVDGSPPARDALAHQLTILEESPNTAVVGAKRVSPGEAAVPPTSERGDSADVVADVDAEAAGEDPAHTAESADVLVDVGLTLSHGGRIITGVDPGEIDQGQADWRHDVLAVALPGMLVREQTLSDVGGLDPDLPAPWAEIDLCQRVWRSGERVAVQAEARVLHPLPTRPRLERLQEQRTGRILVLLKHRPLPAALVTLLLLPLATLLRMMGAIAASSPRTAAMELRAWAEAMPRVRRVLARGLRDRRRARVPRGRLAPLYLPRGEGLRRRVDDTWTRLFADDDRQRRIRHTTWGVAGTRHGLDDADYGRHIVWTAVVALAATVLGLFGLRGLFGRGELQGPGLRAVPDDWTALWSAAWSSWIPGGLGERGPGDALVRLLGHLPVSGSLLVETLIFAALPASALFAWWASGALTRAVGARLVIATVWALAPPLLAALAVGAWPLLLVHTLLPLLALAVGRAIGLPHKISQASVSAAAAAGLLLLVIGAVQPVLALLVMLALVLLAAAVPGRRRRLLWVVVPTLALHAPYLPLYLGHPRALLAVSGVPPAPGSATPLDLLGLWPVAPGLTEQLIPLVGTTGAMLLPLLPAAPVVLGALLAPLLAGAAGRVGRFSLLATALVVLTVLAVRSVRTAVLGEELVTSPLHGVLSAALLALGIGATASFDALARREAGDRRIRRAVTGVVGTVIAAVCLVSVAGWTLLLPGQLRVERVEGGEVPAAAADQGRTEARSRVLVLEQQEDGAVEAGLVVQGGDSVIQHAVIADARDVDTVAAGEDLDGDPASAALRETVAGLLSDGAATTEEDAATQAIAYVVVQGDPEEQALLREQLDSSTALEKVTEGAQGGMWRVLDASPRAVVTGGASPVALASGVIDASGTVPVEDAERTVILSERHDTQWRATLDGAALTPVEVDGWAQGFVVPAGEGGEIDVHREQPARLLWQILLYAAVALTALIAIPWRVRTRTAEEMYG
ncbi:hypothetical protein [Brachybacterium sp. YJGR34]|uniref:hypothetical protein n=1 Tax=Brachybacterium sp. YJGR34 TaxID=2059911 RepID=UPI000E09F554|nr:hypothetical protein [Brachybacterium sp. YJGR34]